MKSENEINIFVAEATEEEPRHQAGTILPFDDGRLLLCYSHFYDKDATDAGPAHIVARWSHDQGETWDEPYEVQPNIGHINCMTPSLLRLPSGRILLEFMRKDAQKGHYPMELPRGEFPGLLFPMVKYSDDEGKTWSEPKEIVKGNNYWCSCHDRLFRSSTGRVLLMMTTQAGAFCWYSDDDGASWQQGEPFPPQEQLAGYAEPIVFQMKDGRLQMWLRNQGMNFHVVISEDDGHSWQLHSTRGLNARNTPCMIRRIEETGDLLVLWNNNQIRTPLNCAISSDEGDSWHHIKDIEPMTEWPKRCVHAYPSLAINNGFAHITYYESVPREDPADAVHLGAALSLKYRRLPIEWFYQD